jgi:[ribosomal protein S5]-alanine N-acetyltransferase
VTDPHSAVRLLLDASARREIPVPIVTERLELRPFHETDIDAIAQLLTDREATRFIGDVKTPQVAAESVRAMRDAHANRGWGTLAVVLRSNRDCVGYCGVRPLPHTAEVEVAFALLRLYWNRGYATEAATASIDAAFNCLGIGSIVATVYPDNKASIRVLTKLGMRHDSEVFGHWPMHTALLYRVDREEWGSRTKPTK